MTVESQLDVYQSTTATNWHILPERSSRETSTSKGFTDIQRDSARTLWSEFESRIRPDWSREVIRSYSKTYLQGALIDHTDALYITNVRRSFESRIWHREQKIAREKLNASNSPLSELAQKIGERLYPHLPVKSQKYYTASAVLDISQRIENRIIENSNVNTVPEEESKYLVSAVENDMAGNITRYLSEADTNELNSLKGDGLKNIAKRALSHNFAGVEPSFNDFVDEGAVFHLDNKSNRLRYINTKTITSSMENGGGTQSNEKRSVRDKVINRLNIIFDKPWKKALALGAATGLIAMGALGYLKKEENSRTTDLSERISETSTYQESDVIEKDETPTPFSAYEKDSSELEVPLTMQESSINTNSGLIYDTTSLSEVSVNESDVNVKENERFTFGGIDLTREFTIVVPKEVAQGLDMTWSGNPIEEDLRYTMNPEAVIEQEFPPEMLERFKNPIEEPNYAGVVSTDVDGDFVFAHNLTRYGIPFPLEFIRRMAIKYKYQPEKLSQFVFYLEQINEDNTTTVAKVAPSTVNTLTPSEILDASGYYHDTPMFLRTDMLGFSDEVRSGDFVSFASCSGIKDESNPANKYPVREVVTVRLVSSKRNKETNSTDAGKTADSQGILAEAVVDVTDARTGYVHNVNRAMEKVNEHFTSNSITADDSSNFSFMEAMDEFENGDEWSDGKGYGACDPATAIYQAAINLAGEMNLPIFDELLDPTTGEVTTHAGFLIIKSSKHKPRPGIDLPENERSIYTDFVEGGVRNDLIIMINPDYPLPEDFELRFEFVEDEEGNQVVQAISNYDTDELSDILKTEPPETAQVQRQVNP